MNEQTTIIKELVYKVERRAGRAMATPKDFELLQKQLPANGQLSMSTLTSVSTSANNRSILFFSIFLVLARFYRKSQRGITRADPSDKGDRFVGKRNKMEQRGLPGHF